MQVVQSQTTSQPQGREIATLAAGCFWCLEAIYDELRGVKEVVSGYSGGSVPNPSYEMVCTGTTGHAEVVQITFDSKIISFKQILQVFFTIHDPTTVNRQGPDVGTQCRSAIFYSSPSTSTQTPRRIPRTTRRTTRKKDKPTTTNSRLKPSSRIE